MKAEIQGSRRQTEYFWNLVLLNGEGYFIPERNRTGGTPPGCFWMYVTDGALELLKFDSVRMLADGKLYPG